MAENSELILTLAPGLSMTLVRIEPGKFWMGSDRTEIQEPTRMNCPSTASIWMSIGSAKHQ